MQSDTQDSELCMVCRATRCQLQQIWQERQLRSARVPASMLLLQYLRSLLRPDWEVLNTRGQLVKALASLDPAHDALREEGALAALVAQEDDVQSLHNMTHMEHV